MLELKNLTKTFGHFNALDNLNMTVPTGAVYGLVGPNGAGKSTAIRHMTGVYRPDAGSVTLDGVPVYENTSIKSRMAAITDDLFFFNGATIEDMRKFYAGIYPKFDNTLFKQVGEAFDLPKKTPVRRFSKGMQKQAAFWLTISCRPEVMILDEPVDGLDPVMRRQVWSLILSDVAQQGTTILVSSHNLRELEDICDHVGIMNRGRMLLERSLADMQGNTIKIQMVGQVPEALEVLHRSESGRLTTLVVRSTVEKATEILAASNPVYYDILPLSLEEIFIYELGGVDYEIKDIIL